jgi:hypothetical protein
VGFVVQQNFSCERTACWKRPVSRRQAGVAFWLSSNAGAAVEDQFLDLCCVTTGAKKLTHRDLGNFGIGVWTAPGADPQRGDNLQWCGPWRRMLCGGSRHGNAVGRPD